MLRKYLFLLIALVMIFSLSACSPAKGTAEWHADRGYKLFNQGHYDEAIKECTEAIELAPNFAEAYNTRGIASVQKDEFNQAIADFDKAIELDPELAKAYNNRGYTYYLKGEVAKAISDFETCIKVSNDPILVAKAQQLLNELR